MLTGSQLIAESKVRLGEGLGSLAQVQSSLYPKHARRVADQIARRTWMLYRTAITDIVAGQIEYVMPERPYRDVTFNVMSVNGTPVPLQSITSEEADRRFLGWRDNTFSTEYYGIPRYYIAEGANTYKIFPSPNYNWVGGIMIEGYFGVGPWWDMATESPLEQTAEECHIKGIVMERCKEMFMFSPSYQEYYKLYQSDYEMLMRQLYREAVSKTPARRGGIVPAKGNTYPWCGSWGWAY